MAYYGSGYSQGVGGQLDPINSSPQGAPIPGNFYSPGSAGSNGFNSSQAVGSKSAADQLTPPGLAQLNQPNQAGHYESYQQALGSIPQWASQYITQNADSNAGYKYPGIQYAQGHNTAAQNQAGYVGSINGSTPFTPSSGQLNDAYMATAPTLSGLYNQYGSNFDPTKLTGLWGSNGATSLMGVQQNLQSHGYGLGNIGNYYQDNLINNGQGLFLNGNPFTPSSFTGSLDKGGQGTLGGVNFGVDPSIWLGGNLWDPNSDWQNMMHQNPDGTLSKNPSQTNSYNGPGQGNY